MVPINKERFRKLLLKYKNPVLIECVHYKHYKRTRVWVIYDKFNRADNFRICLITDYNMNRKEFLSYINLIRHRLISISRTISNNLTVYIPEEPILIGDV